MRLHRSGKWPGSARSAATLVCGAALISGCAREHATVTLGKDGTWTRRTVYVVTNLDPTGGPPDPKGLKLPQVSDSFQLPAGDGWKLTNQATKDEKRVIAERTLPLNESLVNDIVVKEAPKKDLVPKPDGEPAPKAVRADDPAAPLKTLTENKVTVRQLSPGRYAYTETIHWTGEQPSNLRQFDAKEEALVRASLPPALATDENVKTVTELFSTQIGLAMVGPPRPLVHRLPMLMSAPEAYVRLITQRVGPGVMEGLAEKFGSRMTPEQRLAITMRLAAGMTEELKANGPDPTGAGQGGESSKNSSGASILISVKLPGRVVATNGVVDNFTGEITWSFYPEAAAFGDLTLTATLDGAGNRLSR